MPADVLGVMSRLVGILASDALGTRPIAVERIRGVDPLFGEEARWRGSSWDLPLQEAVRLCEPPLAGNALRGAWGLEGMGGTMSRVLGRWASGLIRSRSEVTLPPEKASWYQRFTESCQAPSVAGTSPPLCMPCDAFTDSRIEGEATLQGAIACASRGLGAARRGPGAPPPATA